MRARCQGGLRALSDSSRRNQGAADGEGMLLPGGSHEQLALCKSAFGAITACREDYLKPTEVLMDCPSMSAVLWAQ